MATNEGGRIEMKDSSLKECLNYIQVSLNAPKDQNNDFGHYKYRNVEGIFGALKPLLQETGCVINASDTIELVGERYYIKSLVTISKGDESEASIGLARESEGRKGMDDAQCTGACSSYARKYALCGLFAIDGNQDIDSMDNSYTITNEQKEKYQELLQSGAYNGDKQKVNKWWKGLNTFEQAESGLIHMEKIVTKYKEKEQHD